MRFILAIVLLFPVWLEAQTANINYGTLATEKEYYTRIGQVWTAGDIPTITPVAKNLGIDVHGNLEADDLWQNIIMWQRTGNINFYNQAVEWADYYLNDYLTDFQTTQGGRSHDLNEQGGDHAFGCGLVLWGQLTGNSAYAAKANEILDLIEDGYDRGDMGEPGGSGSITVSVQEGNYGVRPPARHLKLAVCTGRMVFADRIWNRLKNSPYWNETEGVWLPGDHSGYPAVYVSLLEFGLLADAMIDYYDATGDATVRARLIRMADFAMDHTLHSTTQHSGSRVIPNYPSAGQYCFTHYDVACGGSPSANIEPNYTVMPINLLVKAWKLTGTRAYLDRAALHWNRYSGAIEGGQTRWPANEVGYMMNSYVYGGSDVAYDGQLTYASLLFKALHDAGAASANATLTAIPANTALSLGAFTAAGSEITAPMGSCAEQPQEITDYSRMAYDLANHQMLIFGGGHSSTPRTDVIGFDFSTLEWHSLYSPTPVSSMNLANVHTDAKWASTGQPIARHTWDMAEYNPVTGEYILMTTMDGRSICLPPELNDDSIFQGLATKMAHFQPDTDTWTYSNSSNLAPGRHTSATAYDPVSGMIIIANFNSGNTGVWTYNAETKTLTEVIASPPVFLPELESSHLVYSDIDDKFYYISRNGPMVVTITPNRANWGASTITNVTSSLVGTYPTASSGYLPCAYSLADNIIGCVSANHRFYQFNPLTLTWTTKTMTVNAADQTDADFVAFDQLAYDVVNQVFIFISSSTISAYSDMKTFAYSNNGFAGETPPNRAGRGRIRRMR